MVGISVQLVTKELMLACRQLGHVISEALSALVVSTIVNPSSGTFYVEKPIYESDARTVIEDAAKKILSKEQPGISCLRLQAAYEGAFADLDADLQKRTQQSGVVEDRLVGFISGFEAKFDQDFESLMVVYKKIYQFLLIHCTQPMRTATPPKDPAIEREVAAALESVFPRVGLRAFVALTGAERAAQLHELASIVFGIRLFNQHQGKGGTGIPRIQDRIASLQSEEILAKTQAAIEEENGLCKAFADFLKASQTAGISGAEEETAKVNLIYHRQYLCYLLNLEEDLVRALDQVMKAQQQLEDEFADLDALVGGRASVPKEHVYPRFDSLARVFHTAWREVEALEARTKLNDVLKTSRSQYFPELTSNQLEALQTSSEGAREADQQALTVSEELEAVPGPGSGGTGVVRLTQENYPDFLQVALDFQGFCIHTFVTLDRVLVPGNPALGVFKHGEYHAVFATESAALQFCADPEAYISSLKAACYKRPELIHLLGLHKDFPSSSLQHILQSVASTSGVMQADVGTATPLHFQDSYIDKTYQWNEWKLRSDALQMANIKKRATSTTQTALSHLRRENETQVYLPRDMATNTVVNSGTNPVRWRRYIRGLRGEPQPMVIVEEKFDL